MSMFSLFISIELPVIFNNTKYNCIHDDFTM